MKTILLLLLVGVLGCTSCSSTSNSQASTETSRRRTTLSEMAVRNKALAFIKTDRRDADRYEIKRIDLENVKGQARWVVTFGTKGDQIVDSDFWVDVDDQTGRTSIRSHFAINQDDH